MIGGPHSHFLRFTRFEMAPLLFEPLRLAQVPCVLSRAWAVWRTGHVTVHLSVLVTVHVSGYASGAYSASCCRNPSYLEIPVWGGDTGTFRCQLKILQEHGLLTCLNQFPIPVNKTSHGLREQIYTGASTD